MSDVESVEYESDEEVEDSENEDSVEEEVVVPVKKKRKGKKKRDPNKPKRNMSAFFLYSNAHRARVREENPDIKFGDVAKVLSGEFRALDAKSKKKWDKLAEKDKERYKSEMENYESPSEESDSDDSDAPKKRRKKAKKDPNKPKRNLSSFFIYSNQVRESVKNGNPDAKFGDIAKIISVQFKALDAEKRAELDKLAAEDKVRYQTQMADYKRKNGLA